MSHQVEFVHGTHIIYTQSKRPKWKLGQSGKRPSWPSSLYHQHPSHNPSRASQRSWWRFIPSIYLLEHWFLASTWFVMHLLIQKAHLRVFHFSRDAHQIMRMPSLQWRWWNATSICIVWSGDLGRYWIQTCTFFPASDCAKIFLPPHRIFRPYGFRVFITLQHWVLLTNPRLC